MQKIETTAFEIAQRYIGIKEIPGKLANPQIVAMLQLEDSSVKDDEVPWCSAFVNYVCWLLRLPRSKSLSARSWLSIGQAIDSMDAEAGFDVVVLKRGGEGQPGPEVLDAPGHVGFFAGLEDNGGTVLLLAGNQGDAVNVSRFPLEQVLGFRRIYG